MAETFRLAFSDPTLYQGNKCSENIARLLERLDRTAAQLPRVIFLLHEEQRLGAIPVRMKTSLAPATNRERQYEWNYHTILEQGGYILDLHASSKPIKAREYFAQYFPPEHRSGQKVRSDPARWDHLYLKTVDPADYLASYRGFQSAAKERAYVELGKSTRAAARGAPPSPRSACWNSSRSERPTLSSLSGEPQGLYFLPSGQ